MFFKNFVPIYTLWFDTNEEEKDLIDNEEFYLNKEDCFTRAQVIANVTGKVVIVRRIRLCSRRCKEYMFFKEED